jgi:predicted 2-oxoglutarate/Fe(II)-dependent dioxygenase YbiX
MFDGQRKGIPILSVLGALDDGYKGGEFVMWEDTVIDMPKGSVMVFPSNFMYPHKVNEITEGVRHSVVSWVF